MGAYLGPVELDTPCEPYSGFIGDRGYGLRKHKGRTVLAHRLAWIQANGPIPDGLYVLHRCDNPPCLNVKHLFLGTAQDNMDDMRLKGRNVAPGHWARRTHCSRGHEYTEENTRITIRNGSKRRICRTCHRERERARIKKGVGTSGRI